MTTEETGQKRPAVGASPDARGYKHAKTVVALLVVACVLARFAGMSIWINNQATSAT